MNPISSAIVKTVNMANVAKSFTVINVQLSTAEIVATQNAINEIAANAKPMYSIITAQFFRLSGSLLSTLRVNQGLLGACGSCLANAFRRWLSIDLLSIVFVVNRDIL